MSNPLSESIPSSRLYKIIAELPLIRTPITADAHSHLDLIKSEAAESLIEQMLRNLDGAHSHEKKH
jgi:hypothetical protein